MAEDDVTDLTEDEQEPPVEQIKGKPKKGKAAKEPKAAKESKDKEKAPKAKGEKGGSGGIIIIMILVLVILIGSFVATVFFDLFDSRAMIADVVKDPMLDFIIWLDPGFTTVSEQIRAEGEAWEQDLRERDDIIVEREVELQELEDSITAREQQLHRRAIELDNREQLIIAMYERATPLHRRADMTEEDLEDMLSLVRTYSNMAPDAAAAIMIRLHDQRDVAAIIYYMSERNAAAILTSFTPEYAAQITEILLYS